MKRRIFSIVVEHRKAVIVFYVVVVAICAYCATLVGVDYDINDYLPEQTASTRALDVMESAYDGGIPNARVMVRDVSVKEAAAYEQRLQDVDGVEDVVWLDDYVSTRIPYELIPDGILETYYKDGNALFSVTIDDDKRIEAVDGMRAVIGDDNAMAGSAVSTAVATTSTVSEIRVISALAVAFVLLVLVLTTTSWIEPVIVLASLGAAVVINSGTHLVFGTVSFVTNAACSILQLGISLDFAVFLLHRFEECRSSTRGAPADMVEALCLSSTSILSSALTVTFGFLALTVMQFLIGPDLGFALAKGMLISVVTVFSFTAALLVACDGAVSRTRHRPFVPSFERFGRVVTRIMVPAAVLCALLPIPSYLASTSGDIDYLYGASHVLGPETRVGADSTAIEEAFGTRDTYALLVPQGDSAAQRELSAELRTLDPVVSVLCMADIVGPAVPDTIVPDRLTEMFDADGWTRMVVTVDAEYEGNATFSLVDEVRAVAESHYPGQWLLAGQGVSTTDLMLSITEDKDTVDLLAVVAVFVVLTIALRSAALPIVLVLVIETAIWVNFSIPYVMHTPVFYIAYLIVSAIQLGATVDYAILLTDRYREERASHPKRESVVRTLTAVTVPILTSGSALTVCGFALGVVSTHGVLSQLGYFLGRGTLLSLVAVLLVLPGLLYAFDGVASRNKRQAKT